MRRGAQRRWPVVASPWPVRRRRGRRGCADHDRRRCHGQQAGGAPARRRARIVGGCPVFPADNAWNQEIASAPLHPLSAQIISHIQAIGGDFAAPGLRREPDVRHPVRRRPVDAAARADRLRRLRRRERSRAVPDTARRTGRGRQRRPRARAAAADLPAVRAVRRSALRRRLGGRSPARGSTCSPALCDRSAGPAPTPPGCRSCPGWCATTRWPPA